MRSQIALIPAYEPSKTLADLAKQLKDAGFEVIIVDDGSKGKYVPFFKAAARYGTVLTHSENRGKGRALKTGLTYIKENFSENSVIVTLDSDGQHSVRDTIRVCKRAAETSGCLFLGSRGFDGNVPSRSRFGNHVTRFVYRLSTGTKVRDTQTGLRAFGFELIPFMLSVKGERYEYEMNVLLECVKQNIRIIEVEIETIYLNHNAASHFNTVKDSFRIYREIIKFAASSFTGFLIDYGMYSLLVILTGGLGTSVSIPLSNIIARITSASVNYSINKHYIFKNKEKVTKTAAQYFVLAACILCGNTLLLSFLVNSIDINRFIAKIFTEITFFTLSWITQRFIIFRKTADTKVKIGEFPARDK